MHFYICDKHRAVPGYPCYKCEGEKVENVFENDSPVSKALDSVNHPSHYNTGRIEVIEFIEDKNLGFHLGNAIKYIARAGKKDKSKTIEDLEKAIWYVRRQIVLLKSSDGSEVVKPNDMSKE